MSVFVFVYLIIWSNNSIYGFHVMSHSGAAAIEWGNDDIRTRKSNRVGEL